MAEMSTDHAILFRRFEGLGRKDQQAILNRFSEAERIAFEDAIEAERLARAEEARRLRASDRQYLGYSAWLANLVEASVGTGDVGLTRQARTPLAAEHKASFEVLQTPEPSLWQSLVARVQEWFAPTEAELR